MVWRINNALFKETGERYQGFLYAQMMKGISPVRNKLTTILTEVNVRLGDSEAINVLPILDNDDPVEIYWSIIDGTLSAKKVRFDRNATVCKYLVPEGYPETPKDNQNVELDESKIKSIGARYYWASVNMTDGIILTSKSRAVAVLGVSEKLEDAEEIAEKACACFRGQLRHRSDVGKKVTERIQNTQNRWKAIPKKGTEESSS
jgi:phosphoribosylamine--glycine ligase